jgi:hypothetical protein
MGTHKCIAMKRMQTLLDVRQIMCVVLIRSLLLNKIKIKNMLRNEYKLAKSLILQ